MVARSSYTFQTRPSPKNTSGRVGVYRTALRTPYWVAMWQDPLAHNPRRRFFSITRYGEDAAYQMAVAARVQAEQTLISQFGIPGVQVQRCRGAKSNGWQVRWHEPVSDGYVPATLFFSLSRYGGSAEHEARAFAERVRLRLAGARP